MAWSSPALTYEERRTQTATRLGLPHVEHARNRLDGARHLRADLEAAGQLHLHLAPPVLDLQHERHLTLALLAETPPHGLERPLLPQEDADAALRLGGR